MTHPAPAPDPAPVLPYAGDTARRHTPPLWWRLGLTLACIYLPYAWLLTDGFPVDDYRLGWIKMWPVLPGLIAGMLLHPHASDAVQFVAMGGMTAAALALFLALAARSRRRLPVPTLLALAASAWNSWAAHGLYWM